MNRAASPVASAGQNVDCSNAMDARQVAPGSLQHLVVLVGTVKERRRRRQVLTERRESRIAQRALCGMCAAIAKGVGRSRGDCVERFDIAALVGCDLVVDRHVVRAEQLLEHVVD